MSASLPPDLISAEDYARRALALMSPAVRAYVEGGSGGEQALRANLAAFAEVQLYQRILRKDALGSTRLQLVGQSLEHPILLAPVAQHGLVHADAELASARAARATDTVMVVSTQSSRPMEETCAVLDGQGWFQLYFQPDRNDTLALLRRAEAAGFRALMLTLDGPVQASSRALQRLSSALPALSFPNIQGFGHGSRRELPMHASVIFQGAMADAPDAADIEWLRRQTPLPILAKGVAHPDDAAALIAQGIDGIVVSNHGGRSLDAAPASLHLLPAIRARLGDAATILLDGGIRSGSDVFKALALGADAVLIGRPQLHALAVAGALGLAHLLKLLRQELELTMALTGCFQLDQIGPHTVFPGK